MFSCNGVENVEGEKGAWRSFVGRLQQTLLSKNSQRHLAPFSDRQ